MKDTLNHIIDHIIAECSVLALKAYFDRHNRVGKIVHMKLSKLHVAQTTESQYYEYDPQPICESNNVKK